MEEASQGSQKKARTRTPLSLPNCNTSLKKALVEDFNNFFLEWEDEPHCTRLRCTVCYLYWITNATQGSISKRQAKYPFVGIVDPKNDPDQTCRTPSKWNEHQQNAYHQEACQKGNVQETMGKTQEVPTCRRVTKPSQEVKPGSDSQDSQEDVQQPTRFKGPPEDEMSPEQLEIRQEILASRPRTGLSGPFGPWLAVPDIARPAQALGRACRYGTSLSFRESELVILLTGAKTRSNTEFQIHTGEALKAGLTMEQISAIPRDTEFSLRLVNERLCPLLSSDRERCIVQFAAELLDTCAVSDATYSETRRKVGDSDRVLVEITSIVGYYTFVAYTLNVFRIAP